MLSLRRDHSASHLTSLPPFLSPSLPPSLTSSLPPSLLPEFYVVSPPPVRGPHSHGNEWSSPQHADQQHHHQGGARDSHGHLSRSQYGHSLRHSLCCPHSGWLHVPVVWLPQFRSPWCSVEWCRGCGGGSEGGHPRATALGCIYVGST